LGHSHQMPIPLQFSNFYSVQNCLFCLHYLPYFLIANSFWLWFAGTTSQVSTAYGLFIWLLFSTHTSLPNIITLSTKHLPRLSFILLVMCWSHQIEFRQPTIRLSSHILSFISIFHPPSILIVTPRYSQHVTGVKVIMSSISKQKFSNMFTRTRHQLYSKSNESSAQTPILFP
jgi:hypothetical protein